MRRRSFLSLLGSAALAGPLGARAQARKPPVVGFLNPASAKGMAGQAAAFRRGLEEAGFTDGRNVKVEYRWADGQYEKLPGLAAELVDLNVAVIAATGGSFSVRAAKEVTEARAKQKPDASPTPVLFVLGISPVAELAKSLEKPDASTGVSIQTTAPVLLAKRVELLRQLMPKPSTIALLTNSSYRDRNAPRSTNAAEIAAASAQFAVTGLERSGQESADLACDEFCPKSAKTDSDLEPIFIELKRKGNAGLIVGADVFLTDRRALIAALAKKYGVPTIYPWRECVDAGGLMSYGPSLNFAYRQIGQYAGKILRGANSSDLPVLQEGRFDLALNLPATTALKLTFPPTMIASADYIRRR